MRRLLLVAVAAAALGSGGAGTAQADVCVSTLLCGISGCTGTVNVCGGGSSCSGLVDVCPFTDPDDCHGSVDVCPGLAIGVACAPIPREICDLLP